MRRPAGLPILLALVLAGPAAASPRDDARVALGAGAQSFIAGNARAARIELLNAIKADPHWALPHALQGRVYLALGDGAAAEKELRRAVAAGMKAARLSHLFAHAYLLQGDASRALGAARVPMSSPVSRAYSHRIAARAAVELGKGEQAAREFDAALALTPRSSLLWSDIGRFRLDNGDVGGAIAATRNAVRLNPANGEALLLMGRLVRGQYGLRAALPWFERARELDPASLDAMAEAAATLGDAGQDRAMLAVTRDMLAIDPGNARALYLQAVLAARMGNEGLARGLVYRIGGRMDSVPGMLLLQSVLEMRNGSYEQAIDRLERLSKMQPRNLVVRRLRGAALIRSGDPRSAIALLEPLARQPDAESYTLTLVGRAYEAIGDRSAAALYLDRAARPIQGDPAIFDMPPAASGDADDADIAIPRIGNLVRSGRLQAAFAEAQRLRARYPSAPAAHVVAGDVLWAMAQPAEAAIAYRAAANIEFSEPTALRFVAALQRSGQSRAALEVLQLYLDQNPRSLRAERLTAEALMTSGQWDRAIALLADVRTRLGNRDAGLLANLGWAWSNKGKHERASRFGAAAYRLAPSNPAVVRAYGEILKQGGKGPAAAALFRKGDSMTLSK